MSDRKLKVANLVWILKTGGIEATVINLYRHMNRDKVAMDFIIDTDSSDLYDDVLESSGAKKIEIFSFREFKKGKCYKLRKAIRLYKIFKKNQYDVVYNNVSYPSTLMYGAIAKMAGVSKVISYAHSTAPVTIGKFNKAFHGLQRRIFSRYFDTNIAVSKEAGTWIFGNRKFVVISNGIDFNKFKFSREARSAVREQLSIGDEVVLLGNIGRLTPSKNQLFLLDVFANLGEDIPEIKLVIAGDGELQRELKDKAVELGISKDVLFYGYAANIEELLSAIDIFLFPSLWEGFGIAAIEAQASGLATLISDALPDNVMISDHVWKVPLNRVLWEKKVRDIIESGSYINRNGMLDNKSADIQSIALRIQHMIEK